GAYPDVVANGDRTVFARTGVRPVSADDPLGCRYLRRVEAELARIEHGRRGREPLHGVFGFTEDDMWADARVAPDVREVTGNSRAEKAVSTDPQPLERRAHLRGIQLHRGFVVELKRLDADERELRIDAYATLAQLPPAFRWN